jgi:hypothetical protein
MRKKYQTGKRGLLLLLPLVFWLLPTSWLESKPSICPVRHVFGLPCPGCGMVRALSCLGHGQIRKAWQYNRLVVIVAPLLAYTWGKTLLSAAKRRNPHIYQVAKER